MLAEAQPRLPEVADAELIRSAAAGDEAAFVQLYRRHSRYVAGIIYRLIGSDADVDDVVQLTFIEALRSLSTLTHTESFRGWLYRLSVRQVNRRLKKRWRMGRLRSALEFIVPKRTDPREADAVVDLYAVLESAAPDDRLAWLVRNVQGESLEDSARLCGTSLATIKRRIARAERIVSGRLNDDA